jgi:uncharacterized protein YhaN
LLALVLALSVIVQGAESEIEFENADANLLAHRDSLTDDIRRLKAQAASLAKESATWSSATPDSLRKKINSAATRIKDLDDEKRRLELNLPSQKAKLASLKASSTSIEDKAQLAEILQEIQTKKASLGDLTASNRIVYNFRATSKTAWIVEISGDQILAAKVTSNSTPRRFSSAIAFNKFAANLPSNQQYFVLILKPSGIAKFDQIKAYLKQEDLDLGTELIGEDQVVVDPKTGAGF